MVVNKKAQGKKNRAAGARFEKKIRAHFESEDWIIDKWSNNVDLDSGSIIPAKNFYMPGRGFTLGAGFPDFVMLRINHSTGLFRMQLVECKINGKLDKEEKLKCKVLVDMGIDVQIAYEDKSQEFGFRLRKFEWTEGIEKIPRGPNAD